MSVMSVGIAIPSNSVSKYEHRAMGVGAAAWDNACGGALRPVVPENSEPNNMESAYPASLKWGRVNTPKRRG